MPGLRPRRPLKTNDKRSFITEQLINLVFSTQLSLPLKRSKQKQEN